MHTNGVAKGSAGVTRATGSGFTPQFEFGSGLRHTTFGYTNLRLAKQTLCEQWRAFSQRHGKKQRSARGKEIVQLYTIDLVASLIARRLKGLRKYIWSQSE
jgi:hypothetical protein